MGQNAAFGVPCPTCPPLHGRVCTAPPTRGRNGSNPKPETRGPKGGRNPKAEMPKRGFGLRYSAFFWVSACGIRTWTSGLLAPSSSNPAPDRPAGPPGASPYTSVPGQRYYGKGPVRLWGATEYERAGGMLFWHVEAAKVQQLQQVRRWTALTHERISNRSGAGTRRVGTVLKLSRNRTTPLLTYGRPQPNYHAA